jgi:hypothetical protein
LTGQSFELVSRSQHWGEERVIYRTADGTLPSIAVNLTDLARPDAFCRIAAGRAAFRIIDLLALSALLEQIGKRLDGGDA